MFYKLCALSLLWIVLIHAEVYKNMGQNGCIGRNGIPQTCGYLQFCSETGHLKGCRNCTEITDDWCDIGQEEYQIFTQKYPTCEIICEKGEMKAKEIALQEKEKVVQNLQYGVGGLSVFGGVAVCVIVILLAQRSQKQLMTDITEGTASKRSWFPFWAKQRRAIPVQPSSDESLPMTRNPGDSGHGSTQNTPSSSTLTDVVAPTGGIVHHPDDTQDFMRTSV
ncbi:uncharacterized protein LOC143280065 isoform X2 [Babylonia areolata]